MSETLPDPRKRPRQARSVATFEAILEAAARILESLSFAGFNTNAVAELAGVSIGSLYQYFPSKDALIVELIRRERAKLSNHIIEAIQLNTAEGLKRKTKTHHSGCCATSIEPSTVGTNLRVCFRTHRKRH